MMKDRGTRSVPLPSPIRTSRISEGFAPAASAELITNVDFVHGAGGKLRITPGPAAVTPTPPPQKAAPEK